MTDRVFLVVALVLAGPGCSRPDAAVLPTPRGTTSFRSVCQQPTLAAGQGMPDCEVPGDVGAGSTLVVEVFANGQPGRAYVSEVSAVALEECLSSAVHEWVFIPAKDCEGAPVAGVWKQHYSAICGDTLGAQTAPAGPSPPTGKHR